MKEYFISQGTLTAVCEEVSGLLNHGYELAGGLIALKSADQQGEFFTFYQAVVGPRAVIVEEVRRADIQDDELLSCPFCGGEPKVQKTGEREMVMCLNGNCQAQPSIPDRKTCSARSAWNTRVIE